MIDLSLFVPSYLLENKRFKQFIEVLSESVEEVLQNVSDLNDLWQVWKREDAVEWISLLLEKIGFNWFSTIADVERVVDGVVDFLRRKGCKEFFDKFFKQLGGNVVFTELNEKCLMWSQGRGWSSVVYEDSKFYREYSILAEVTFLDEGLFKRLIPLGVFVWIMRKFLLMYFEVFFGLRFDYGFMNSFRFMLGKKGRMGGEFYHDLISEIDKKIFYVSGAGVGTECWVESDVKGVVVLGEGSPFIFKNGGRGGLTGMSEVVSGKEFNNKIYFDYKEYRLVLNTDVIVLA